MIIVLLVLIFLAILFPSFIRFTIVFLMLGIAYVAVSAHDEVAKNKTEINQR